MTSKEGKKIRKKIVKLKEKIKAEKQKALELKEKERVEKLKKKRGNSRAKSRSGCRCLNLLREQSLVSWLDTSLELGLTR